LERIETLHSSLADDAWKAELALASYRTRLLEGPELAQKEASRPGAVDHSELRGSKNGIKLPADTLTPITNTLISETTQTLDWGDWRNVTFEDVHIEYHGGPVMLTNVRFIHCTFGMSRTSTGARLVQAIVREPYTSGKFVPVG